jgi:hypothetical protein
MRSLTTADQPRKSLMMSSTNAKMKYYESLLYFFIRQRLGEFDIPDEPFMEPGTAKVFKELVRDSTLYLEYGSGGSTVLAARLGKSFISVDTDGFWLRSVRKKIGRLSEGQRLVHAEIGLTGPWGYPLKPSILTRGRKRLWRSYASRPWVFVRNAEAPDLVLVDGRFRVASALTSFVNLEGHSHARILVDDYVHRPEYHVLEKFGKLIEVLGQRMAIFQPPARAKMDCLEELARYSLDWR